MEEKSYKINIRIANVLLKKNYDTSLGKMQNYVTCEFINVVKPRQGHKTIIVEGEKNKKIIFNQFLPDIQISSTQIDQASIKFTVRDQDLTSDDYCGTATLIFKDYNLQKYAQKIISLKTFDQKSETGQITLVVQIQ